MATPNAELGQKGELTASKAYTKNGYTVLGRNLFNARGKRLGEIDFVAIDDKHIVFVEVKTRSKEVGKFGTALESVNKSKQLKILKSVKLFLLTHKKYQELTPRIDVCVVALDFDNRMASVIIYKNAVEDWS